LFFYQSNIFQKIDLTKETSLQVSKARTRWESRANSRLDTNSGAVRAGVGQIH
jgi:hypothetical protein